MAHRLPGRIPWTHPHPPAPVHPSAIFLRSLPAPIAHFRTCDVALCQTRARNHLHPPILFRHYATAERYQKFSPLLAPGGREHRILDLPPVRSGRGAIQPLHHLSRTRTLPHR